VQQMPKIIILRGNSGSGKSTVAKALQKKIGKGTLLISQDYVRREMLWANGSPHNTSVDLLKNLVTYGHQNCDVAILEGILSTVSYESLFALTKDLYGGQIFAYYFDLPFEETLARHKQKPISHEVGEAEMRAWWREKDFMPHIDEKIIDEHMSLDETVERIYCDITDNS